jgi:hypothetical protein
MMCLLWIALGCAEDVGGSGREQPLVRTVHHLKRHHEADRRSLCPGINQTPGGLPPTSLIRS